MKYRISHVNVWKSSFVLGALSLLVTAPLTLIGYLSMLAAPPDQVPMYSGTLALLAPIFYSFFTGLLAALSAWMYNRIAAYAGGIEITLDTAPT